jgi:hypothetical protein
MGCGRWLGRGHVRERTRLQSVCSATFAVPVGGCARAKGRVLDAMRRPFVLQRPGWQISWAAIAIECVVYQLVAELQREPNVAQCKEELESLAALRKSSQHEQIQNAVGRKARSSMRCQTAVRCRRGRPGRGRVANEDRAGATRDRPPSDSYRIRSRVDDLSSPKVDPVAHRRRAVATDVETNSTPEVLRLRC